MILQQLTLRNFCLFQGKQVLDLAPAHRYGASRPIVLIGGIDGEKIRALADDTTSSETLGTAIKALLGLDIVERLITDAAILEARLAKEAGTPEQRAEAEQLEEQLGNLQSQIAQLNQERASLE